MALPLVVAGLRTAAAFLLRSGRGAGLIKGALTGAGKAVSALAKASPMTQLMVGGMGVSTGATMVKQAHLNAKVRHFAPR